MNMMEVDVSEFMELCDEKFLNSRRYMGHQGFDKEN
jgi:hypothetical protein